MDETSRLAKAQHIRDFCARNTRSVLFDEPASLLMDVFSGRTLAVDWSDLAEVESRVNAQTQVPYLVMRYESGRNIALSDVGIAFAPDIRNTGLLSELPTVVCFRDFVTLLERFKHELYGHADSAPTRNTLTLLMMCIAIVDGARSQGFDVGREEKELEWHLGELEKRAPLASKPPST